ncbi:MAG: hypothetical protein JSS88_03225 [Actinobacteria bacterium]|nr:hypothetical protein [Actinomycetota bacterium]
MSTMPPLVIFVDAGHWNSFDQLSAVLRRHGCRTVRVTTEGSRVARIIGRLVYDEQVRVPCIEDGPALRAVLGRDGLADVQCVETALPAVAAAMEHSGASRPVLASIQARMRHLDKYALSETLRESGIRVPQAIPGAVSIAVAAGQLSWPFMVKRRVGFGGLGVQPVSGFQDAAEAVARFGGPDEVYFEQMIGGENIAYASMRAAGATTTEAVYQKLRFPPESRGPATSVELVEDEQMRAIGRASLEAIRLDGLANLEALRGDDGLLYVNDVNLRVWASALSLKAAGLDFGGDYARFLRGAPGRTVMSGDGFSQRIDVFPAAAFAMLSSGSWRRAAVLFGSGMKDLGPSLGLRYCLAAILEFARLSASRRRGRRRR